LYSGRLDLETGIISQILEVDRRNINPEQALDALLHAHESAVALDYLFLITEKFTEKNLLKKIKSVIKIGDKIIEEFGPRMSR